MKLRPYQTEAIAAIRREFSSHQSTLAVLATGLGKTVIFSSLARDWTDRKVLVLAHREELVFQAAAKIEEICGEPPLIEMASQRADQSEVFTQSHVVVASVQTLCSSTRQKRFNPMHYGLVIIDEAHHDVPGSQYEKVTDYFKFAKRLGVTATPKRHDQSAMEQRYESVAYQYEIVDAVDDGYLVPVHQAMVRVDSLDFSKVRSTAGDLNEGDLEKILIEEKSLHGVAIPTVEMSADKPTLVFCVSVHHAELMAEVLGRYKSGSAVCLHGKTSKEERRKWIKRFKNREIQYLCNCGIFLEGFDAPQTAFISMARPTKSLPLYTQVVGRGTRALPGVIDGLDSEEDRRDAIAVSEKPYMTVLDFVGNSGRHKLISSSDVLGGKYDAADRKRANQMLEDEPGDAKTAVQVAAALNELEKAELGFDQEMQQKLTELNNQIMSEERRRSRERIRGEAEYTASKVNIFDGREQVPPRTNGRPPGEMATEKQVALLKRLDVPEATARGYSKRQAGAVIDSIMKKRKA